jgi:hypothetical protein
MSSNGEVYSIQHYVIKFVIDLLQVGGTIKDQIWNMIIENFGLHFYIFLYRFFPMNVCFAYVRKGHSRIYNGRWPPAVKLTATM